MTYNLSEKAIAEKYEDLLFTKVMALYAAEESEKILSEIENEEPADPKNIEKIYSKTERRKNLSTLWKYSKKLVTFAAMVVFVAVISLSSVVVASAEAREAVAEAIYHLVLNKTDRYTEVSIGESTGFIDPEIYTWENAYAPTYMPDGFVLTETYLEEPLNAVVYYNDQNYIFINQMDKSYNMQIDTENAITEKIYLHNSEGLLVKKDELTTITWCNGETLFEISGNISTDEIIKIAESVKPIEKYEVPDEEEYTFVDPENYDFEGAYAPTYMSEGFVQTDCSIGPDIKIHSYSFDDKFIYIEQNIVTAGSHIDTENADVVKELIINNSQALYVEKGGLAYITWSFPDALLFVCGNIDGEEIIKVAQSIKPIN